LENTLLQCAESDIIDQVEERQNACKAHNPTAVRNTAPSLKSLTAIAGLPQLESACKIIDRLFADGIFHASAADSFSEIIYGWEEAKPQLERLIATY